MLQICSPDERANALQLMAMIEYLATFATVAVFGFVYSFLAQFGKGYLTFLCTSVSVNMAHSARARGHRQGQKQSSANQNGVIIVNGDCRWCYSIFLSTTAKRTVVLIRVEGPSWRGVGMPKCAQERLAVRIWPK